jgi:hypothetical protein
MALFHDAKKHLQNALSALMRAVYFGTAGKEVAPVLLALPGKLAAIGVMWLKTGQSLLNC